MFIDAATTAQARLHPAESQRVFRVLVDALTHPGRLHELPAGLAGRMPMALGPLLAVTDIEVTVAVHPDPDGWAGVLGVATGASPAEPAAAEWVAFLEPPTAAVLATLDPGSPDVPERGTRVVIAVESLAALVGPADATADVTVLTLHGPGVQGRVMLGVGGVDAAVFEALAAVNAGFPAGIDTWLVTADGTVAGIPRSTSVHVHATQGVR